MVGNKEKQIILTPEFPGSTIYHIFIEAQNHGMVQKITRDWNVTFNENSLLDEQNRDAIIRAVSSAEYLNN